MSLFVHFLWCIKGHRHCSWICRIYNKALKRFLGNRLWIEDNVYIISSPWSSSGAINKKFHGHACYETLCESAHILPLNVYCDRFLGIEVYKCVNGLNPKYMNDMLVIRPDADRLRDSSRAIQPEFNSFGFGFKSFKYFGAKLWNVLPITVKRSDNLFIFKDRLTEWCHANRSLDIF